MNEQLGWAPGDYALGVSSVDGLLRGLMTSGQVDRVSGPEGRTPYRYFVRSELAGPIADLEHAYRSEAEAA